MLPFDSPLRPLAAVLALAFAFAAPAAAQQLDPAAAERRTELRARAQQSRERLEQESAKREEWQTRYRNLLVEVRAARENQSAATIERRKLRKQQRLRGDTRREADEKIEESDKQSQLAQEELVDFYERARAEGIEPGWLREVEDDFPTLVDSLPEHR